MSNHRFVTSLGFPYFAFVADNIGDVNTLPSGGLAAVYAEFRVDSLPVQSASADEIHPFFAFDHGIQTQPPIFEIGVTPSGRFGARAKSYVNPTNLSGQYLSPRTGLFSGSAVWNTAQITYNALGPGAWDVTINGVRDLTQTDLNPSALLPNVGYGSRLLMFNGRDGLARTGISIRNLLATFVGVSSDNYEWKFSEGEGRLLTPTITITTPPDALAPAVMDARFYEPLITHPWGAVPSGAPSGAYRWGLATDYTRLPKPVTTYTRVPS